MTHVNLLIHRHIVRETQTDIQTDEQANCIIVLEHFVIFGNIWLHFESFMIFLDIHFQIVHTIKL